MNWHFGHHSLLWDNLLSLDTLGRDLVLPQLGPADFVDSPKEDLTPYEEWEESICEGSRRGERELGLVCEMKK